MNNFINKDNMVSVSGIIGILGVVALHYGTRIRIQHSGITIDVESMQRVVQETTNNLSE